ncbi:MAG: ubiquitin-like domain-containing protein, partial [Chloroflexota bacterium]
GEAAAAVELLRTTAAAFPRAGSVILARLRPPEQDDPWWTLVEVDGRSLRAAPDAASVEAALAAAGVRLEEGDRVVVVPNEGAPLASGVLARRASALAAGVRQVAELPPSLPPSAAAAALNDLLATGIAPAVLPAAHRADRPAQTAARSPHTPAPAASPPARTGRIVVQRAEPFSVVDGGVPVSARAAATTVGEALRAVGIDLHSADLVRPPAETPFAPGIRVTILRARPVAIVAHDLQVETRTRATTVGDLLAEQHVVLGPLDRIEPPVEAAVPAWGTVRITRVHEENRQEFQVVPFRTQVRLDPSLPSGSRRRLRAGVTGLIKRVTEIAFEDGVEAGRQVIGETVVRRAVDQVIVVGPAAVPVVSVPVPRDEPAPGAPQRLPDGTPVRRTLTMEATAYDPGPISTGKWPGHPAYGITAIGMRAGHGVVAVDPRVIPFRTRLYIPGYGYAVAGDTGSAIVGNRIDLGYASYGEAIRWGRRTVTVYILG